MAARMAKRFCREPHCRQRRKQIDRIRCGQAFDNLNRVTARLSKSPQHIMAELRHGRKPRSVIAENNADEQFTIKREDKTHTSGNHHAFHTRDAFRQHLCTMVPMFHTNGEWQRPHIRKKPQGANHILRLQNLLSRRTHVGRGHATQQAHLKFLTNIGSDKCRQCLSQ